MDSVRHERQFLETLEATANFLNQRHMNWTVLGGAAMALLGFEHEPVHDIDIVLPSTEAASLAAQLAWPNYADGESDRFRSDFFFRPDFGPVRVELLGGFRIKTLSGWVEVEIGDRQQVTVGAQLAFTPSAAELAGIFRLCGRRKDLLRSNVIEKMMIANLE